MPKLTQCLTMICAPFLIAGCADPVDAIVTAPLFCDLVTEPFTYTQDELDYRADHWPYNLRTERKINKHYDRRCITE